MHKIGRFFNFGSNLHSIEKKIFLTKSKFEEGCDTPQIIRKCQLKIIFFKKMAFFSRLFSHFLI